MKLTAKQKNEKAETEAKAALQLIADLSDALVWADKRMLTKLEDQFQRVIAEAECGVDDAQVAVSPKNGWNLSATDIIRAIRVAYVAMNDIETPETNAIQDRFDEADEP